MSLFDLFMLLTVVMKKEYSVSAIVAHLEDSFLSKHSCNKGDAPSLIHWMCVNQHLQDSYETALTSCYHGSKTLVCIAFPQTLLLNNRIILHTIKISFSSLVFSPPLFTLSFFISLFFYLSLSLSLAIYFSFYSVC